MLLYIHRKGCFVLKEEIKKEIPAALLAGAICGIIALAGLLFAAPERWYLAFVIAAVMAAVVLYKSASERKKNSGKYERDEHLVDFPYVFSAEGYLRGESDKDAKFYFGADEIGALHYKNARPVFETFSKEKIKAGYPDRCGWFSIIIAGEKTRIVIPKENAQEASMVLEEILKND